MIRKAVVTGALALGMLVPSIAPAATPGENNAREKAESFLDSERSPAPA